MVPPYALGDKIGIVGWNCNILGPYSSHIKFVNKLKGMPENFFVLCDTRFGLNNEAAFRKLWGEKVFFKSHSPNKRGLLF